MEPTRADPSSLWTGITRDPIRPELLLERVGAPEDGAVLLFLGTVRNHADGRPVASLRYDAYVEMAQGVLAALAREAADVMGVERIAVVHRIGHLEVGEVSVGIAVSSPHRADAYRTSRWIIEEIKKRLPVWKKEGYADGGERWVEGTPVEGGEA